MPSQPALTLFELNQMVRDAIESTLIQAYWVTAELSEVRQVGPHLFMELIQKDPFSSTPVARASAKCWGSQWSKLKPKFMRATGSMPRAGMQVMLLVEASFHEAYGFSWVVVDIDPNYTLGDMARKRQEIIARLKEEGVFDLQKSLRLPMFAQHVAVISSATAAGYGDFCKQLDHNDHGYSFMHRLFPAIMQGQQVEQSIIHALEDINREADNYDVVVIIRGGGATADMSGFDTLKLAENVANFPLPIITGIGHDRDESVLDMVSNTRVKTPTAAAAFLIDHLASVEQHLIDVQHRLVAAVGHRMDLEQTRLTSLTLRIPTLFALVKERGGAHLDRLSSRLQTLISLRLDREHHRLELAAGRIRPAAERIISTEGASLNLLRQRIGPAVERKLTCERNRLSQLQLHLDALNPDILLSRGYSITLSKGKIVKDAALLHPGDQMETRFAQGKATSTITKLSQS